MKQKKCDPPSFEKAVLIAENINEALEKEGVTNVNSILANEQAKLIHDLKFEINKLKSLAASRSDPCGRGLFVWHVGDPITFCPSAECIKFKTNGKSCSCTTKYKPRQ